MSKRKRKEVSFYYQMHLQLILCKCATYPFVIMTYAALQYLFAYCDVVWYFVFNVYINQNIYTVLFGGHAIAQMVRGQLSLQGLGFNPVCCQKSGPEADSSLRFFRFPLLLIIQPFAPYSSITTPSAVPHI
jgi:hypothetical protein